MDFAHHIFGNKYFFEKTFVNELREPPSVQNDCFFVYFRWPPTKSAVKSRNPSYQN